MIDKDTAVILVIGRDDLLHSERITDTISLCEKLIEIGGKPRHSLTFDGYGDDPRDIWEIPECVSVCFRILREIPKFIQFVDGDTLGVILYATAMNVNGVWIANPAWEPYIPNFKKITLARK